MRYLKAIIEHLEILFRSCRMSDDDIKVMIKKGYGTYDAIRGRFIKSE